MTARQYTLDEIGRIRAAMAQIDAVAIVDDLGKLQGPSDGVSIEEKVQAAMAAGVAPEELEEEAMAAVEAWKSRNQEARSRASEERRRAREAKL